jgi:hypothetical protein
VTVKAYFLTHGFCMNCGQPVVFVQPGKAGEALKKSKQSDPLIDVFILGKDSATCSNCGFAILLPAGEATSQAAPSRAKGPVVHSDAKKSKKSSPGKAQARP